MAVISVYNQAKTPLGFDLAAFAAAMQTYVDDMLGPVWMVSASLKVTTGPTVGFWGMVFLDDADAPGALAYHTDDGLPLAKVFVRTILDAHESVTVAATHELAEMLCDAACNRWVMKPDGTLLTLEVADAVEETSFKVDGFEMSDFCYPAWFGEPGSIYDHCGVVKGPFELASGGYATQIESGAMKTIFGSAEKAHRFSQEDRRGHRTEYRRHSMVEA